MITELTKAAPNNHGSIYETDLYDFAGWLTTRPGVMAVGSSCEAGPMAEAVGEYIKTFPERFALTQRPAQTEREAWGWAIEDKHGVAQAIRPACKEFFGCVQSSEPFTAEDVSKMDREWEGLAPHRIVTLYTRPAQTEQQPVASAPVADERAAKLDAECNSLAHQLNASNERNGMLRAALSDCSAELFAQCGDQSRAMSYVNADRAALSLRPQAEIDVRNTPFGKEAEKLAADYLALMSECAGLREQLASLRPQAVPMTREQAMAIAQSNPDTMTAIRMTEAHHGITAPAGGEKQA